MTDAEFLAAFEGCTFERSEWTHEAHVRMAWLYLTHMPFVAAIEQIRSGLKKLSSELIRRTNWGCYWPRLGSSNDSQNQGYHETITVAFARLISHRLGESTDFPTFRDRNPDLLDRTLSLLFTYYSRELLHSPAARKAFVAPDLVALPELAGDRPDCGFIEPAGGVSYPVEHDRTRVRN